jgi:heat shock protein HslJ
VVADAVPEPAVLDRSWTLASGHGPGGPVAPLADHPITLELDGDRWAGSAGCNRYTTTVVRDGDHVSIPRGIATTLMACRDEVMVVELAYLGTLPTVRTVELVDGRLTLRGAGAELVFEPTGFARSAVPLVGTGWTIVAIDGDPTGRPSRGVVGAPALRLSEDGNVTGTTGCNRFFGRYQLDGTSLAIGPLATTRMACDELAAGQEAALLRVLSDAALEATVAGDTLHLSRADGGAITCSSGPVDD